jgi:hypothetical protein
MHVKARWFLLGALVAGGCHGGNLKVGDAAADAAAGPDLAPDGMPDLATSDAGPAPDLGTVVVSPSPRIRIARPAFGAYVPEKADVEVSVDGPAPAQVTCVTPAEVVLARLGPPFRGSLDTARQPEGPLTFSCLFVQAGEQHVSAPITVTLDRTPPRVITRSPGDGSEADPASVMRALFSEPIADIAADASARVTVDGAAAASTVAWSADRTSFTITLASRPRAPAEVRVTLGSLTDRAGNPLAEPGPWRWRVSSVVNLGGPLAAGLGFHFGVEASLAVDAAGKPWVAWRGGTEDDSKVQVQSWNAGQTRWDALPSLRVATADKAFPIQPSLALDPKGLPVVAWSEVPKPYWAPFKIHVQRWNGTAWEALEDLPDSTSPDLVVDGAGNMTVIVTPPSSGGPMLVYRWREGHWQRLGGDVAQLGSTIGFLAGNARGDLEVTWTRAGDRAQVPERRRLAGDAWTVPAGTIPTMSTSGTLGFRGVIGADGVGRYTWLETLVKGGTLTEVPALFMPGWADRQLDSEMSGRNLSGPRLALDNASAPVLAFGDSEKRSLLVRRWTGSAWQTVGSPIVTSPDQEGAPSPDGLAFTPAGQLVIAVTARAHMSGDVFVYLVEP